MTYTLTNKKLAAYAAAGAAVMGTAGVAQADFTGYYDHSNWTFTPVGDAFVSGQSAAQVIINGSDDGTGGTATYTIAAQAGGTVQFDFSYFSTDVGDWDDAGFYLNGSLIELANNSVQNAGTFSTNVNAGDVIGFWVRSADGAFGRGVFTITNFSAPTGGIPEPGVAALLALGTIGGTLATRRRRVDNN